MLESTFFVALFLIADIPHLASSTSHTHTHSLSQSLDTIIFFSYTNGSTSSAIIFDSYTNGSTSSAVSVSRKSPLAAIHRLLRHWSKTLFRHWSKSEARTDFASFNLFHGTSRLIRFVFAINAVHHAIHRADSQTPQSTCHIAKWTNATCGCSRVPSSY